MREYLFEKLEAWKLARAFRRSIYQVSKTFPPSEKFGLTSQVERAASSITANLAEGAGRLGFKDKIRFVNMAYASCLEVLDHIIGAHDLGYIDEDKYVELRLQLDQVVSKIERFTAYLNKKGSESTSTSSVRN